MAPKAKPADAWFTPEPNSGCFLWLGTLGPKGYGLKSFRVAGRSTSMMAHKFYWQLENGLVPDGYELDHKCRNRICVNPAHLEVVTHRENVRRGKLQKLTTDQVAAIRREYVRRRRGQEGNGPSLAAKFGVCHTTIYRVVGGA